MLKKSYLIFVFVFLSITVAHAGERMLSVPAEVKLNSYYIFDKDMGEFAQQNETFMRIASTSSVSLKAVSNRDSSKIGYTHRIDTTLKFYGEVGNEIQLENVEITVDDCSFYNQVFEIISTDDYYFEGKCTGEPFMKYDTGTGRYFMRQTFSTKITRR